MLDLVTLSSLYTSLHSMWEKGSHPCPECSWDPFYNYECPKLRVGGKGEVKSANEVGRLSSKYKCFFFFYYFKCGFLIKEYY